MDENLKLKQAVTAGGGVTLVAARLGKSPQVVSNWISRGKVPVAECAAVVDALEGAISKTDLRPDDWQSIWPELQSERSAA